MKKNISKLLSEKDKKMKNQIVKFGIQNSESQVVIKSSEDVKIQCDDCDVDFKSEYHLDNHIKSSQHLIKTGLNRKFSYKVNDKTTKSKLLKGALKNLL